MADNRTNKLLDMVYTTTVMVVALKAARLYPFPTQGSRRNANDPVVMSDIERTILQPWSICMEIRQAMTTRTDQPAESCLFRAVLVKKMTTFILH